MMEQNENKQEQLEETAAAEETTNEEVSAQETEDGTTEERPNGWKKELLSWVWTILCAVVLALLIRTFVFEPVRVDGHSMNDTLDDKEIVFVTKYDYLLNGPEHFDIVICHYPNRTSRGLFGITTKTNFVKRLVGMPGDTIEIRNGVVVLNGEELAEDYLTPSRNTRKINMPARTLGDDEYFVMGDNRDNSNDSRSVGVISRDMIIGHVRFVFFPFNQARGVE